VRQLSVIALVVVAGVVVGCTNIGPSADDASDDPGAAPAASVTAPAIRLTPFCQAMIDLDQQLPADPTVDATDQILAAYLAARPDAPPEIAADFDAVINALRTGVPATVPPTTAPPAGVTAPLDDAYDGEGYVPDDTPSTRVNAYIDLACRNTQNNPGPPATQPDDIAPPTTTS
jgi:hypothetical protein